MRPNVELFMLHGPTSCQYASLTNLICSKLRPTRYIKAATKEKIDIVAVTDKAVFDNYISGGISDEKLPKDAVEPLGEAVSSASMDVDEVGVASDFTISAAVATSTSTLSDAEVLELVLGRERSVHNAKSVLIAPAKDFKTLFASQYEKKATAAARPVHDRYAARPDQDYYRNIGIAADDIDTRGSMFFGGANPAPSSSSASSRAPVSAPVPRDRRPGGAIEVSDPKKAKAGLKPIIVVPGTVSSPINRYNMKRFFGESTYDAIDPNDTTLDEEAPHRVEFVRKKENGEEVPYEVVDNTAKFTAADWERVIAIFTIGKVWQFKAYPYKEDRIADMFQKHCGFYIRLGSEKIPQDTIAKWKVKIINVSKSHRHMDAATLREFWDTIDTFVKTNKIAHLKY